MNSRRAEFDGRTETYTPSPMKSPAMTQKFIRFRLTNDLEVPVETKEFKSDSINGGAWKTQEMWEEEGYSVSNVRWLEYDTVRVPYQSEDGRRVREYAEEFCDYILNSTKTIAELTKKAEEAEAKASASLRLPTVYVPTPVIAKGWMILFALLMIALIITVFVRTA